MRAAHTTSATDARRDAYRGQPAQRLWVLSRGASAHVNCDVCGFASAVAVLDSDCVFVTIIRASSVAGASETALSRGRTLATFERNAARFVSLDDAIGWASETRDAWIARGWEDVTEHEP